MYTKEAFYNAYPELHPLPRVWPFWLAAVFAVGFMAYLCYALENPKASPPKEKFKQNAEIRSISPYEAAIP